MNEKLYDDEIAPKLLEVGKICQQHGIPFVALVEYAPDMRARTEYMPESASPATHIAAYAARCDGNVDSLIIATKRLAEKVGHSSIVLTLLERRDDIGERPK